MAQDPKEVAESPDAQAEEVDSVSEGAPVGSPDPETASAASNEVPYFPGRTQINVCTSEYTPMVYCKGRESDEYTGYEIEVFWQIQPALGWKDSMLNWSCLEWDEMIDSLVQGDGRCDLAVGGVGVSSTWMAAGVTYTWPSFRSGLTIMTRSVDEASPGLWTFMDAFTWDLWLAIILTLLTTAVVLFLVERWWALGRPAGCASRELPSLQDRVFRSLGRPMQTTDLTSSSFAASVIIILFSFMMMILVTLYTANTAANLTAERIQTTIKSVADLPGKAVGTIPDYQEEMKRRNVATIPIKWDDVADEEAMLDMVRSGELKALVLDSALLQHYAAINCDLMTVGGVFNEYDQGTAFPAGANASELITAYNEALVVLKDSGFVEERVAKWVNPQSECKMRGVSDHTAQISFTDVAGLWVLLAAGTALACLLAAAHQAVARTHTHLAKTAWYSKSSSRLRRGSRAVRRAGSGLLRGLRTSSRGSKGEGVTQGAPTRGSRKQQGGGMDAAEQGQASSASAPAAAGMDPRYPPPYV